MAERTRSVTAPTQPSAPPAMAAPTAPQQVCPSTSTRRPAWDAAYTTLASCVSATTLPATRTVNRSPTPAMKMCSGTTRESEQVTTMAKGRCPSTIVRLRTSRDVRVVAHGVHVAPVALHQAVQRPQGLPRSAFLSMMPPFPRPRSVRGERLRRALRPRPRLQRDELGVGVHGEASVAREGGQRDALPLGEVEHGRRRGRHGGHDAHARPASFATSSSAQRLDR